MIPISMDQKLKYEIDGVVYLFNPPIGELEIKLQEYLNKDEGSNVKKAKGLYPEAVKVLEKEFTGKRKPPKKQWSILIEKKLIQLMEASGISSTDIGSGVKESKAIIDSIVCGWESEKEIPAFPQENPSQFLTIPLMNNLMSWYWGQYSTTEDELKNS